MKEPRIGGNVVELKRPALKTGGGDNSNPPGMVMIEPVSNGYVLRVVSVTPVGEMMEEVTVYTLEQRQDLLREIGRII